MTASRLRSYLLGFVSVLSAVVLTSMTPTALAQSAPTSEHGVQQIVQAQPAHTSAWTLEPGQLQSRVTDASGVLTPEQAVELENSLNELMVAHQKSMFIVFMPSFGNFTNVDWAEQARIAQGGGNTLVMAIATEDRQYGLNADTSYGYWSDGDLDDIEDAILPSLADSDWAGAGFTAADSAIASAEPSKTLGEVWKDLVGSFGAVASEEAAAVASEEAAAVASEEAAAVASEEAAQDQEFSYLHDASGVLEAGEFTELSQAINEFRSDTQRPLYVGYLPSSEGDAFNEWIGGMALNEGTALDKGREVLIVAIYTEDREASALPYPQSEYWSEQHIDHIRNSMSSASDSGGTWVGSGLAAVQAARESMELFAAPAEEPVAAPVSTSGASEDTSVNTEGSSLGVLIAVALILFLAVPLVVGAFIYRFLFPRFKNKLPAWLGGKGNAEANLATARSLASHDTEALARLPISTLEVRADELIVATDEAVRSANVELKLAEADFGSMRVREFSQVTKSATASLEKAQRIQQKLNDSIPETEPQKRVVKLLLEKVQRIQQKLNNSIPEAESQRRAMLVEVISVCSLAQEELAKQVDEIASLRNQVASAGAKLDELTRRSIVLRTRLVAAQETFVDVKSRYAPEALASIDDNVEMATVALEQADRQLDIGRAQEAKPAGQQGGVINALREVERALDLADRLLLGVEHADNNIAAAHDGLEPLMEEVRGEIREAEQLKERGAREGTPADWDALDETVAEATALLVKARVQEETDPLGVYTELLDIDGRLDEHLDTVRASTAVRGRQLSLLDKQMESARVQIQVADDLISSRGVVVQAQARTHLATAKELALQAMNFRITNTREAADYALRAAHQAKWASDKAQEDIRAHQKQMDELEANRSKEIAAGMVAAQLLAEAGKTNQAGPPAGLSDQERRKREREETRKGKWARWISSIDDSSSSSSRSSTSSRNDSGGGSSSRGGSF